MITNHDLNLQYSIFSQNIKAFRKKNHLTQEQLAEQTDLSTSYIKQIESGKEYKNVSLTVMFKLSKALNTNIHCLFQEQRKN